MRIGIMDADLIYRRRHRFPNLVCMKLAGYHKQIGNEVVLHTRKDVSPADGYDLLYVAKVFTDTPLDINGIVECLENTKVIYNGTGFFFDNAMPLPREIEHTMPDYHLYYNWLKGKIGGKGNDNIAKWYQDYSIGFLTRGCFRHCPFCVNQRFNKVEKASPLEEFLDTDRPKIAMLDDNFLGYPHWKEELQKLMDTNKPFVFRQGLDERVLNEEMAEMLFASRYDGDMMFAFDNIEETPVIERKLKMMGKYRTKKTVKFYVLTGFKNVGVVDIVSAFQRIELLMKYHCLPYVTVYRGPEGRPIDSSPYRGMYVALARWANMPRMFKKTSFRQFCLINQEAVKTGKCSALLAMEMFEKEYPDIAKKFFDMRYEDAY